MPRISDARYTGQLRGIALLLAAHPYGIGRAALAREYESRYGEPLPERAAQRRLERLVEDGRVRTAGEGRNRIYFAAIDLPSEVDPAAFAGSGASQGSVVRERRTGDIPLSPAGAEVRALVRRPIVERWPVGYEREFLDAYEPGSTWYLPEEMRARLHELGATPDPGRPAGTFARDVMGRLLIDLAWASSRLEGNTYTRLDTANLLEFGQRAAGKDAEEAQMILNHKQAIELLVEDAASIGFDRATLFTLHGMLAENLLRDPGGEGRLRTEPVYVTGTRYLPVAIPQVIEECFTAFLERASAIPDPFEQAFFAMVHLPYLQPFSDVNKRTSRLAANIPLVRANLCPLSFVDVPRAAYVEGTLGVYELRRVELLRDVFAWAYARSCAQYKIVRDALGQPDPVRLRYREELGAVVRETVLAQEPPRTELLLARAVRHRVERDDLGVFAERALGLLHALHEGTARRYRLRPDEVESWRSRFR